MRIYEVVFILRPEVADDEADRLVGQFESVITSSGGTVRNTDRWGRRRLAYEVRGQREGNYVVLTIECDPPAQRELERVLRVTEPIMKFQTVRIDEELKKLERLKAKRDKRRARRPATGAERSGPPASAGASSPAGEPAAGREPAFTREAV